MTDDLAAATQRIKDALEGVTSICPDCGGGMARLGEDITEVLDYVPGRFQVIRHIRPKYACRTCEAARNSRKIVAKP